MDRYTIIIIVTTVGFFVLATILLYPVYRFLRKEEQISQHWTPEALAARSKKDGSSGPELQGKAQSSNGVGIDAGHE